MGNPLAHFQPPQSRPSSRDSSLHSKRNDTSPASESVQVGAFAYRIEATESLCQVTTFFLQQHVYEKYFVHLVKTAYKEGLIAGKYVAMDSSFVKTFSHKQELGSESWNEFKKGYGFKLHILV